MYGSKRHVDRLITKNEKIIAGQLAADVCTIVDVVCTVSEADGRSKKNDRRIKVGP